MDDTGGQRVNRYINLLLLLVAFCIPLYRSGVVVGATLVTILWFFEGRWRDKVHVLARHQLTLAVLLFILLNVASLAWSSDPGRGLSYVTKYRYLLLIPMVTTSLREPFRDRVISALLFGTTLATLLSFSVAAGLLRLRDAYPGNPSPTMSHLDFSMVLALAALLTVERLSRPPLRRWGKAVELALLLLFVGGLVVNIGRSGQFAFIGTATILVPVVLASRSRRAAAIGLTAVALVVALSYLAFPRFHERVDSAVSDLGQTLRHANYEGNVGKRIAAAVVARDMVVSRPLLGTGVGGNMEEFRRRLDSSHTGLREVVYWFPHFHNQYLQIVTELGLSGLASLAYIFLALLVGPYRTARDRHLALLVAGTYLLGFLGDPFLHKQLPLVLFALLTGVAAADGRSVCWAVPRTQDQAGHRP